MLLRASGEKEQTDYNVNSVTSDSLDSGVPHDDILRALTEASTRGDWLGLALIRPRAERIMGLQQTLDALVVAAAFNGITRVADATGIPLDENTDQTTTQLREATGIQRFAYAEKSSRYDE